jgi:hypothetical protein
MARIAQVVFIALMLMSPAVAGPAEDANAAVDRWSVAYNSIKTVVYNHKRHGDFVLGGRKFSFRVKPSFPKTLTKEFLLVDLVNNLDQFAEAKSEVLERVRERAASYDAQRLQRAVRDYGNMRTKKFFDWARHK